MATLADKAAGSEPGGFLAYDAYPATGYMTLVLVAGSMAALAVVSEYSSGLIRTTTTAVPARSAVVLANAVVTAVLWTAVGTAASIGSFLVPQAILEEHSPRDVSEDCMEQEAQDVLRDGTHEAQRRAGSGRPRNRR
ncbi:hypothetical protein OG429_02265 [Streptomyces sp. NBC_00190]|uniref:hypothetical protein n=1 Tax=unclassified Streptomyces TaxID=2593676 RepID=UPI002E2E39B8|nr:hypothetical protein [Streptomyces sp. NBC_00190]WSZ38244.1 hypothetical protein OG239_05265 [Streptomyces sp. NBC_00868]